MSEDAIGELVTPIGVVRVVVRQGAVAAITINPDADAVSTTAPTDPVLVAAMDQLRDYFAGKRQRFDIPLAPAATPHQAAARRAMVDIAPGRTATYGQLAVAIGSGPRAVGRACATNPLPIIVPCHRVLPAGGLGAYSGGGGPETKRRLLILEGALDGGLLA